MRLHSRHPRVPCSRLRVCPHAFVLGSLAQSSSQGGSFGCQPRLQPHSMKMSRQAGHDGHKYCGYICIAR
eukprot:9828398-Lingulodinium_polyedra.AAC.1